MYHRQTLTVRRGPAVSRTGLGWQVVCRAAVDGVVRWHGVIEVSLPAHLTWRGLLAYLHVRVRSTSRACRTMCWWGAVHGGGLLKRRPCGNRAAICRGML
jgi:hypothetical protein